MDESKVCGICGRRFANSKALGGHMRAHFAKFPLPPRPDPDPPPEPPLPAAPIRVSTAQPDPMRADRDEPRVLRARNRDFSFSESPVYDSSETESPKHVITRRRSKRTRRARAAAASTAVNLAAPASSPPQQLPDSTGSVVSDLFSDEDGAVSLMMLVRDRWTRKRGAPPVEIKPEELYEPAEEEVAPPARAEVDEGGDDRSKFRCDTCNKQFASYQALGGHRASHKRSYRTNVDTEMVADEHNSPVVVVIALPAPAGAGRDPALADHKKVHVSTSSCVVANDNKIDLNRLPEPEDGAGDEPAAC